MTDLQLAIAIGAAVVVLWVLAFNVREWRRIRGRVAAAAPASDEPMFAVPAERLVESITPSAIAEAVATLAWSAPIPVQRVQQELRGWRHVGSKPICVAWRSGASATFDAQPGDEQVTGLQVGVLLATRSGPLHAMEYSEWQDALGRLARSLGAQLDLPTMADVLSKARALDQQCAALDAQLSLALTSMQILSVAAIGAAAHAAGCEARGEGRFAMGPLHHQRFSVFPGDTGNSVVLLLDVPRTHAPEQAFDEMLTCAQKMAALLPASLTDESGRALVDTDLGLIREQVAKRAEALRAVGIEPGGPVAQRLFL